MRLIVKFDWNRFVVFSKSANYSLLIESLAEAQVCSSSGYGTAEVLVPDKDAVLTFDLVRDDSVKLPEQQSNGLVERFTAVSAENSKLVSEKYALEQQVKKLEATIESAKSGLN